MNIQRATLSYLTGRITCYNVITYMCYNTQTLIERDNKLHIKYLRTLMEPWPLVRKNRSLSLFHEISLTSCLNCCSYCILLPLKSIKVTRSSLLPTAIVWPSGLQQILIFSPEKNTVCSEKMWWFKNRKILKSLRYYVCMWHIRDKVKILTKHLKKNVVFKVEIPTFF